MKTNTTVWKLYCGLLLCLLGLQGVKAQKQDVELDADGIMRVGAPITIVTIGNSITAGYSNTSSYWAWPAQFGRMIGPDYEVKNYAVSGTTMNLHVGASFRNTGNYPKAKDAGTWSWRGPNGFFAYGREQTISTMTAAKAGKYGVTFTDEQGRQSSIVYNIKVEGEPVCPKLVGYGHNEDGWRQTNAIAVKLGTPVTFAPHPMNGKWEWTGPKGFHSNERHNQIFDFDASMVGDYVGTYTNEAGCRDQLVIKLTLAEEKASEDSQKALPKVYNEDINPLKQIDQAIAKAKKEGKFVICQVGGNWCPWCLRFADFITKDTTISKMIDENFVYEHVNYNPRKSGGAEKVAQAKKMLERLNNPGRFGYPVFVVLDGNGKVLHIQDSGLLEEGKGYNQEKVLSFFKNWTPKAVSQK